MSWKGRYKEQAAKAREAAQQYARVGDLSRAAYYCEVAEVYDKLAKGAKA